MWKLQNIEDEAPLNSFPTVNLALQWSQKKYGLDEVFERVQNDNILLEFDFDKMKDILDKAFAKHTVDESQLKYLQRKYKTIKRHHQNSFTELYMQNLLHLVEHIQSMNDLEFLPDLQETQTTCDQNDIGTCLYSEPNLNSPLSGQFSKLKFSLFEKLKLLNRKVGQFSLKFFANLDQN